MTKLQDAIEKYSRGAGCGVELYHAGDLLIKVRIEFHGPAAHIPSLKNSKVQGGRVPYTNPLVKARLKVLDENYMKAVQKSGLPALPTFGKEEVIAILICAKRKVRFDTDNCLSTIRDWMEPRLKKGGRGKPRGWGVGLVENDSQIKGFVFQDKDLGFSLDTSLLIVQRWDLCSEKVSRFVKEITYDLLGVGMSKTIN